MEGKPKGTITSTDRELVGIVDEVNGHIDENVSYSEILTSIREASAEKIITKISDLMEVSPKYILPLADHLILNKKIKPTCDKHGISRDHFWKRIVPKAKECPEGIALLRELIEPYEGFKHMIDSAYYRAVYREVEKGTKWACELWAKTEGYIKPPQGIQVNVAQGVNVEDSPGQSETSRKKAIMGNILKLKPKKTKVIDVDLENS